MDRYGILAELHKIIKPRGYLEIGVQTGASLQLAQDCLDAVGVDPDMSNLSYDVSFATLVEVPSDEFFEAEPSFIGVDGTSFLDLVFIDGLHHAEQVWKDFWNATTLGHPGTVYVFDDVLPRNQGEASRTMCPGDWTGDVWKAAVHLQNNVRPQSLVVDTFPTGVMIMLGTPPGCLLDFSLKDELLPQWLATDEVPEAILTRSAALQPEEALAEVLAWQAQMDAQ